MSLIGSKKNNRRYPGESCKNRPDKASARREDAAIRQEIHNKLTPKEKLIKLDMKFGVGVGAKKERAKLENLIKNSNSSSIENLVTTTLPPDVMAEIEAINEDLHSNKKKMKAKDRRNRPKK